jgi:CDGSH-type Zn-finger protein
MKPPIHGDKPIVIEESAGKKAYCQCGLSENLPYCDGAHSREQTGLAPIVCEVAQDGKVAICQCRQSGRLPYCDGTHNKL